MIDNSFAKSDAYLKNNQQANIKTLIAAGTLVEGLYVATQVISTYPKDLLPEDAKNQILSRLVKLVLNQEKTLEDVFGALNHIEKNEEVKKLIGQLEELQKVYKDLNVQEKLDKNQGAALMSDKGIQSVTNKVKEICDSLIN